MNEINRDNLERERDALIGNIRAAFAGVTREAGVSWSEADVIDDRGTEEECASARASDTDTSWEELIDDPEWIPDLGGGGFSFLDAIGTRYYLPAAMIRDLAEGVSDLDFVLNISIANEEDFQRWHRSKFSLFNRKQIQVVKRFLLYMDALDNEVAWKNSAWKKAYNSHWKDL